MPGHFASVDNGMDVYRHYIKDNVPLRTKFPSPLRDDKDPSFSIYPHKTTGEIYFTDHGSGVWGNHWSFVQELFGLDFKDAVQKVKVDILKMAKDDKLTSIRPIYRPATRMVIPEPYKTIIEPDFREWSDFDAKFFTRFRISTLGLSMHNVKPAFSYRIIKGQHSFTVREDKSNPIYVITFPSGNMKVYRPLSPDKRYKWLSNTDSEDDIFGFDLLPNHSECIFLIGGNKDVMSFKEVIGYPAISLRSESANLTDLHFHLLKRMCYKLIVFYDNDKQGYRKAEKFQEQYGLQSCNNLLEKYGVKDFAQLVDEKPESINDFEIRLSEFISRAYTEN